MLLEILSHKALVGEMQLVGNLFDALCGVLQHHPHFKRHVIVNPSIGGSAADGLH